MATTRIDIIICLWHSGHSGQINKPIRLVLDVSLLGIYLLFFYYFLVRRPLKSLSRWGAVRIFCASGKYKFFRRLAKRAEAPTYFSANQNRHPVSIALVSSNINTTGTKTFTSERVLFGRLIITMWDVLTVCCSPAFIILKRFISGNIVRLAPGE